MRTALAFCFVFGPVLYGTEASAQPGGGTMDAQSRAELRISVSVLPRFEARRALLNKDARSDEESIALRALNAPKLRYSVVRPRQADGLLVIIPD